MTNYLVRFIGKVIESKRPKDFPKEVYYDLTVEADSFDGLKNATNNTMMEFIRYQGMIVSREQGKIEENPTKNLDARMYVPFNMIACITTETKKINGSVLETFSEGMTF